MRLPLPSWTSIELTNSNLIQIPPWLIWILSLLRSRSKGREAMRLFVGPLIWVMY